MKWLPSLRRDTSESDDPNAATASAGEAPSADSALATPLVPQGVFPAGDAALPPFRSPELPFPSELNETPTEPIDINVASPNAGPSKMADSGPSAGTTEPTTLSGRISDSLPGVDLLSERLLRQQQELSDEQRALRELFTTRLRSDEAQARAVEKLHDELSGYKANFIRQQILPLIKEVIFCHDFLVTQIERLPPGGDEAGARALDATRQMLVDLMFKYDVEPYRCEGEAFDPKAQQCSRTIPTDRADADKTIASRGLPGFRGPEGVVRREQVTVYKFTPGAD